MPYGLKYRGEFANMLPDVDNNIVEQIVRIDISDTTTGSSEESLTGVYSGGGNSILLYPPVADMSADYATRLALFNQWAAFFVNGMVLHIAGLTAGDADYNVVSVSYNPPLPLPAIATPGSITVTTSQTVPTETHEDDITYTSVTEAEIVDINMGGDPLKISVIDNNEDKFTPLRPKQATIQLHTGGSININTFCEGDDSRFYVEIFVDDLIIFKGYLIIPDIQQEFMPDPNILTLTAVDNLAVIKDEPLVDFEGEPPQGDWRIMDFIAWSLAKTGMNLPINVINSVRHGSAIFTIDASFSGAVIYMSNANSRNFYPGGEFSITGTASNNVTIRVVSVTESFIGLAAVVTSSTFATEGPVTMTVTDTSSERVFYDKVYLDARTFEKSIGVCEDCNTVLTKIFKEDSVLFQMNGEWWIVRIDDIQGTGDYSVERFDEEGVYVDTITINRNKSIGQPSVMAFMNDDCVIIPDRSYRKIIETFRYQNPAEIICNIDFSRGDFVEDLTPSDLEISEGYNFAKRFELDNWTLERGYPGFSISNDSEAYIKKLYNVVSYEKLRFAVITYPSTGDVNTPYIRSCALPVNINDRFEASVSFKFDRNTTEGGFFAPMFQFALFGSDGKWYLLSISEDDNGTDADGPRWIDTLMWTSQTSLANYGLNFQVGTDYSKWQSIDYTFDKVPPIPIGGRLYIFLHGLNYEIDGSVDDEVDVHYSSLRFDYYPYINGSYQKFTGQQNTVEQTIKNKAVRENDVFISDAPALLIKGALKIPNGTDYSLAHLFTSANHTTGVSFGEMQAWAVWNQYRLSNRNFDGNVDLLESDEVDSSTGTDVYNGIDLVNKILLTDADENTNNRLFILLHYEMDFYLLEFSGYIASLYKTDIGKIYTDDHNFKYLTE